MRRPGCSSRAGERASVTDVENPMDIDGLSMLKLSSSSSLNRGTSRRIANTRKRCTALPLLHSELDAPTEQSAVHGGDRLSRIGAPCLDGNNENDTAVVEHGRNGALHRRASSSSPRSYCFARPRGTYDGTYEQFDNDGRAFILIASHCTTGVADDATEWPLPPLLHFEPRV